MTMVAELVRLSSAKTLKLARCLHSLVHQSHRREALHRFAQVLAGHFARDGIRGGSSLPRHRIHSRKLGDDYSLGRRVARSQHQQWQRHQQHRNAGQRALALRLDLQLVDG
jgi:hypothetical protein